MAPSATPAPDAPASPNLSPSWPSVTFSPDSGNARLERFEKSSNDAGWKTICQGACTQPMDVRHGYRVSGQGVVNSLWFQFPKSDDALTLKAQTGSSTTRTVGYVLSVAGPLIGVAGVLVMAPVDFGGNNERSAWDTRTYAGGGMLLGGAVMLLTGLALIGASGTTTSLERTPPPVMGSKKGVQIGLDGVKF